MSRTTNLSPIAVRGRYTPARSRRLRLGTGMIAVAMAGGLVALPFDARAQETSAPAVTQPLTVTKQATYVHNLGNQAPPTLTNQFPPQAICLVAPDFCSPDAQQITGPFDQALRDHQPEDTVPADPFVLAQPGDLPVSILAGAKRYESALHFDLPKISEGEEIDTFTVVLTETDPTYHVDSPAFRQFVVGLLSLARQDTSELPKTTEHDPIQSDRLNGIEACPVTTSFTGGDAQDGGDAPKGPEEADDAALDCGRGANGRRTFTDEGVTIWEFDLSLAAAAWYDGTLGNEGVLFRSVGAPNLAYGDPDLTTSEQITLAGAPGEDADEDDQASAPRVSFSTRSETEPLTFGDFDSEPTVLGASTQTFTEVFGAADTQLAPADQPAPRVEEPVTEQAAPAVLSGDPVTEWWVWLLLPLLLGGIFLTTQALTTEPALAGFQERSGAMTRLIEARRRQAI